VSPIGSGRWDAAVYSNTSDASMRDHGTVFAYSKTAHATGRIEVAPALDPKVLAGSASPLAGEVVRESRDSDEHPESVPIVVIFDVTGSMDRIPEVLQAKLPKLYALLLTKGYVEHPQLLFGAVGDANSDRAPLQLGQFESDNRADANLASLLLEGGGGGGNHESYELAAYYVARHTATDAWEKRGKCGYLFLIGDERPYRMVNPRHVQALIGDDLAQPMTTEEMFDELRERWDTYFLFAKEGSYLAEHVVHTGAGDTNTCAWADLLGQNVLMLDDAETVCEVIALAVGLGEGTVDLAGGLDDLRDAGTDERAIEATSKALATVGASVGRAALGETDGDIDVGDEPGAERL
jgi:hypothetical protein